MTKQPCLADGCRRARHVTRTGVTKGYCLEHMRERNRKWTHDRNVRIAEEMALTVHEPETIRSKAPHQHHEPEDILAGMFLLLGRAKEAVAAGEVDQVQLAIVVRTDAEGHNVRFSMKAEADE